MNRERGPLPILNTLPILFISLLDLPLLVPNMNNSTESIEENQDGRRITTFSILRTSAYCVILTLGIVGNVFVAIALKRKRRKNANDWFILNLTISDLLFIVSLASDIHVELASSPYNIVFCKALRPLSTVLFSASIFTMTAMALERYHVITKPFHLKMEPGRARLVIGVIWVVSVALAVPLPIVTTAGLNECVEDGWPAHIYSRIYTVALVVLQYLLPLTIITGGYIGIAIYLWKERASKRMLNIRGDHATRSARRDNIQALKAVLTVVIVFAVCMLPSQLAWLLWEFGRETHQEMANEFLKSSPITVYVQSCANPVIYGTFVAYVRQEFKALVKKCSCCCCTCHCAWNGRRKIHLNSSTPAESEPHQQYKYSGNDNFRVDTRKGESGNEANHKIRLEMAEQRNIGFIEENERDGQESEL